MDIIRVMLFMLAGVGVGFFLTVGIGALVRRRRARRNLQPLLGVVLPKDKEDKDA